MPSEVEFHTGVADPLGYACRLLRKAYRQGAQVLCTAPPATLAELDWLLWTFEERDFVPHVRLQGASPDLLARTPIWLAESGLEAGRGRVLVNLGAPVPREIDAFARLVEVVSTDEAEVAAGRERWSAYKSAGLSLVHHVPGAGTEA